MLTELGLRNFRCFEDHSIPLRACAVIAGKIVTASFASGSSLDVYIRPECALHAVLFDKTGVVDR